MTQKITIRVGATEPQTFTLRQTDPDTGVVSAVDITGYSSVSLFLRRKTDGGAAVTFSTGNGLISIAEANPDLDAGETHGTFTPDEDSLAAGEYLGYFVVVDSTAARVVIPSADSLEVTALERFANDT